MKRFAYVAAAALGLVSVGAKGGGCSAELADDGSSDAWPTAPAPMPGTPKPMTCAFLQQDNCWKRLVTKAATCAGDVKADGRFSEDRRSCAAPSAARLELGGAVNTPAPGNTSVIGTDWRILDAQGGTCATGKIHGIGRTLIDVGGEVATFESVSLLEYRVTCPDGSTYTNEGAPSEDADAGAPDVDASSTGDAGTPPPPSKVTDSGAITDERVCPTFGLEYLAKRAPGVLLSCSGTPKTCDLELWGGETGATSIAHCSW